MRRGALALTAVFALVSLPARAEPTKPTVEKVLEFYHTDEYLKDGIDYFMQALNRRKKEITILDQRLKELESLARRIYPRKNLYKVFKGHYAKATTIENMTALYNWQNGVKGIKLRQAYNAVYKATSKQRQDYFNKESKTILKPNRKNAIATFITSFEQDQLYAIWQSGGDLGVLMGLNGYAQPASRDQPKYMRDKTAAKRTGYLPDGQELWLTFDFYLLKDLKNDEVDELSKFATTAVGQAHTDAFKKALELTLDDAATTLQNNIIKGTK